MSHRIMAASSVFAAALWGSGGAALAQAPTAMSESGWYISAHGGFANLEDSDNEGMFANSFVTGTGTTIPNNTPLPGEAFGWTSEFDTGWHVGASVGRRIHELIRAELELSYQSNEIDRHFGVAAAGIPLADEDAGVLVPGSAPLGVDVGPLVSDGRGEVTSLLMMANVYYDFKMPDTHFGVYAGGGLGFGMVNVEFTPSGVGIVDGDDSVFAYQASVGVNYDLSPASQIYAGYRYRATQQPELDVKLFPGTLEIENNAHLMEVGIRWFL